jgi:hypothetical protein
MWGWGEDPWTWCVLAVSWRSGRRLLASGRGKNGAAHRGEAGREVGGERWQGKMNRAPAAPRSAQARAWGCRRAAGPSWPGGAARWAVRGGERGGGPGELGCVLLGGEMAC